MTYFTREIQELKQHGATPSAQEQEQRVKEVMAQEIHNAAQLRNKYNEMRRAYTALQTEFTSREAAYNRSLEEQSMQQDQRVHELLAQKDDLERRLSDKGAELNNKALQREKQELQDRIKAMYEELDSLRDQKQRTTVECVEVERRSAAKHDQLERTNRELVGDLYRLKEQNKCLESANQHLQLDQERLYAERQKVQERCASLEEEMDRQARNWEVEKHAFKRAIAETEKESKRHREELEDRNHRTHSELQQVRQENMRLLSEKADQERSHKSQMDALREEEETRRRMLEKDKEELKTNLETTETRLQMEITTLNHTLNQYKQQLEDARTDQKHAEVKQHSLASMQSQLEKRLQWTQKERDEGQLELETLQSRLDEKERACQQVDELRITNDRLKLQIGYLTQDIREAEESRENLQVDYVSRITRMQQKQQEDFNDLHADRDRYKHDLKKAKGIMEKRKVKYASKLLQVERRNAHLMREHETLQMEHSALKTKLHTILNVKSIDSAVSVPSHQKHAPTSYMCEFDPAQAMVSVPGSSSLPTTTQQHSAFHTPLTESLAARAKDLYYEN
eukprot:TRINITY_DN67781_c5_g10_i1.p1 TRINITY_DN67781_c5_g10~~TRINITY_DN67781_c5_g10_i1.p1  ORF type:complete len:650 (+),score=71.44 TRINITY_DN67781_c5_g10_i1:248-1951(+)